ncbi:MULTISPECIES: hypothetical protein [Streptomyces]|uniref:Uracil-DNA glycosylase-like domain-containing protein n=1 Tax=Streptomyces tsukubensis (strain DSM 42081 / NBRC 108919 / NRRL 18488 / 9993) TaxID=1114943 RepID=I2NBG1_STRT9|nr:MULTISPECIES: hypothetical protein [Streptomyces]AZK98064.1 hypothetical protein B7R87_32375 [Streptomyces tsukubensis]EIF94358.1 hypothetical protein [Streptomyces tsukubensis NRRL18488]MYS68119.1 hypothetical protein [Streptomyces sp. SID5473]QKM66011.1 hypothetical protein STSU_001385 [Streptomyces tsukubensis NRRL18488]TAI42291.1 hypothetical protein EWI31_22125 [Streptomyces tsukubensis]
MPDPPAVTRLPIEVELLFELMPCNALRTSQYAGPGAHPCAYFRSWGTYHSYDYDADEPPPDPSIVRPSHYTGRMTPLPEPLSGCRKAPILAVGINPNLPGWWPGSRNSLTPDFDSVRQYAHYFRYRGVFKPELPDEAYRAFGGGPGDGPLEGKPLTVPEDAQGRREIPVQEQPQRMYLVYQQLLDALGAELGLGPGTLTVGEDLSYGNMVACASAKWTTRPDPHDPDLPPMTGGRRAGIVGECFRTRRHLLRQMFQSLPAVILVLGQSTANAFTGELASRLTPVPAPETPMAELMATEVRLVYGTLDDGEELDARVLFAPHPTGNPDDYAQARPLLVEQLLHEARGGRLGHDERIGHLTRPRGSCSFCPLLDIGPCAYADVLTPLPGGSPALLADAPAPAAAEKRTQLRLLDGITERAAPVTDVWAHTDDREA